MRTDASIRRHVEEELLWEPGVDENRIGVIVNDGVVTLTGELPHYAGRWDAENAAKRAKGVRAIANEVKVSMPEGDDRTDADIAAAAAHALRWHASVSKSQITPVVRDGWLTLSGKVAHGYLMNSAELAVRHLLGIRGITNDIEVTSAAAANDVKQKIEEALERHAALDAKGIEVHVENATITLTGRVHSWQERDDAGQAAWAAPGVARVENRLAVD